MKHLITLPSLIAGKGEGHVHRRTEGAGLQVCQNMRMFPLQEVLDLQLLSAEEEEVAGEMRRKRKRKKKEKRKSLEMQR